MSDGRLLVLNFEKTTSAKFVEFWSKIYNDGGNPDEKYETAINNNELLDSEKINTLFKWKIDHPPFKNQRKTIENAIRYSNEINKFRLKKDLSEKEIDQFMKDVCANIVESGIIFKIFVLHVARPSDFPIFDQHVYRSYKFICKGEIWQGDEVPESQLCVYFAEYIPFVKELMNTSHCSARAVDQALFKFGQFIKNHPVFFTVKE
ncbi:MAG: hypothetical protein WA102_05180 [Candidatus Methanoperedens sp.]